MNFIIRQLEALGDEVAAALDELADEVVGRRGAAGGKERATPELSEGTESIGGTDDEMSSAANSTSHDHGVPTTDDESATDNETAPPSLPLPAPPPPSLQPMSTTAHRSPQCVKRRPLAATRIPAPPPSDPRLQGVSEGRRSTPQPTQTAADPMEPVGDQLDVPSPPYSPVKQTSDSRMDFGSPSRSPNLEDIGEPFVPRPSQAAFEATRSSPTVAPTVALSAPPVVVPTPTAVVPTTVAQAIRESRQFQLPPSKSTARKAVKQQHAPRPPRVVTAPQRGNSEFDLCEKGDSNTASPTIEGDYLVL